MKKILAAFLVLFAAHAVAQSPQGPQTCNGVDDTAYVNAEIAKIAKGGTWVLPHGWCALTSTLRLVNMSRIRITGTGDNGEDDFGGFIWNGPDGGTVLQLDKVRDSTFEYFSILPGKGAIGRAIDIGQTMPIQQISTQDTIRKVHIGASDIGICIACESKTNNELHILDNVHITGKGNVGVKFGNRDSKSNYMIRGTIASRKIGIETVQGSFKADGVNFSYNDIDIMLGAPTDVITIYDPQSEGAKRFLDDRGSGGSAWAVTLKGGRLAVNEMAPDGVYIRYHKMGPVNIEGVDFASGVTYPKFRIEVQNDAGAVLNAIGNVFPNANPFQGKDTYLNAIGNVYLNEQGSGRHLPNVIAPAEIK